MQLIHAIPLICKQKIDDSRKNVETDNVVEDHHLIKNTRVIVLENSFREKCKQKHLCSFCHSYDETIKHIFLECIFVKQLWNHLRLFLTNDISLPILRPQTAIFGFINGIENNVCKITNHIILIFKLHVYKSRERGTT